MSYMKLFMMYTVCYLNLVSWTGNNWLMTWFLMEVALIVVLGLMTLSSSYSTTEAMIKYFIVQVGVSLVLLMLMLMHFFNLVFTNSLMILGLLLVKMGLFPFHSWLILILGKLNWVVFLVLSGPMKLAPLNMTYFMMSSSSLFLVMLSSLALGSVGGVNNISLQKILGYSSMINVCWLLYSLSISIYMFFLYLSGYLMLLCWLCLLFDEVNIFYVNQFKILSAALTKKLVIFLYGLSISGFPPFLGFLIKWMIISSLGFLNFKFLISFMVFMSFVSAFFYLQMFFLIMVIYSNWTKWYSLEGPGLSCLSFILLFSYSLLFMIY